ncbi:MAG: right-handed parallel beta-helix repeat-containing protein, partial [Candidatus Marinimicrobia bacterium]|nr:right-handed parallel beta-helix repeat-containing protein [Candidatus Neomarinimicrobiota bacterium]
MKRILFIFILTSSLLFGITINIPGNYSSIQEGIVASTNGDTVLVASGVYYEQLNFNGKNIVLTSNYIFSNDTSDISNTIIDGNQGGTAITLSSNEDSTSVVNGFTIQNSNAGAIFLIDADPVLENLVVENNTGYEYGAIFVYYNSNPILKNLIIKNNISTCDSRLASQVGGGGIYIKTNCNPIIEDCIISNNTASHGGGIRIGDNSNAIINNCTIKNNESLYDGGGIYIREALPKFKNILVENNIAGRDGGGLFCNQSESQLINSHFKLNSTGYNGGGIYLWESEIYLSGITLINNNAGNTRSCYGGGIYSDSSIVNFNPDTLCNIYNNMSYHADDIYSNTSIDVYVDTFTVLHPTGYQINPLENFTFSINWGKQEQIAQDLYVSPEGDDQNAGTTISDPLKTIGKALYLVDADSLNPRTIHLMDGTYSPTTNNESLPILGIDYVTISGVDSQQTIINTEDNECAFWLENIKDVSIKNILVENNIAGRDGGGLFCNQSESQL